MTASGVLSLATGGALAAGLDAPGALRGLCAVAWAIFCVLRLREQLRGAARVDGFRLDGSGGLAAVASGGRSLGVVCLPGTVVCQHFAWLRLQLPGGVRYGELLCRAGSDPAAWRALQRAWRQRGGPFGRPRGS